MTDQSASPAERFTLRVTTDSHFAWLRTRLSLERTLMACVRTATALIGFGFTIVQFFAHFKSIEGVMPALLPNAPRYLGLALIITGILVLGISVHQYRSLTLYLWSENFAALAGTDRKPYRSASLGVAVLLMIIGTFVFCSVLFRLA